MRPGTVVDERFEIEAEAGAGAMGVVFRARDLVRDRTVALKVAHPDGGARRDARFDREGQLLAALESPYVVPHVHRGVTESGRAYLVMGWLEGCTLAEHLRVSGPPPVHEVVALGVGVARGLDAAHRGGVVHRDVKPSNVFLVDGEPSRPVLIDFGLARGGGAGTLTGTGATIGSWTYMAPEQALGARDVDARADVYSLGCVLHRCLAGQPPLWAPRPEILLPRLLARARPRVRERRPDVPDALDDLIHAMVARLPADRPADAGEVAARLAAMGAVRGRPLEDEPPPLAAPVDVPAPPFVGRGREIAAAAALAARAREDGRGAVMVVEGPGGSGRTRLLAELAARIDGVRCVDDASGESARGARAVTAPLVVAATLSPAPEPWRALADQVLPLGPLSARDLDGLGDSDALRAATGGVAGCVAAWLAGGHDAAVAWAAGRLAALPPPARRLARALGAAVAATPIEALGVVLGDDAEPGARALVGSGLATIAPAGIALRGEAIAAAARRGVAEEDARVVHRAIAEHLAAHGGAPRDVADAYRRAGAVTMAWSWELRAASEALERGELDEALALARRAFDPAAPAPARGQLLRLQASVLLAQGDPAAALEAGRRAADLLVPGASPWIAAVDVVVRACLATGDDARARRWAARLRAAPRAAGTEEARRACLARVD